MLLLSAQHKLVSKASRIERQQLGSALTRQTRQIRAAFNTFIAHARSPATIRVIRERLEQNDIGGAMKLIDQHIAAFGRIIPKAFTEAATSTFDGLGSRLAGIRKARPKAKIAINFEPSNPRAAALMRNSQLQFVQNLTIAQREVTRTALAGIFQEGGGVREAVKALRDSIGLTQTQWDAVEKYRELLQNGSKEALARELRDRRFDRTVINALGSEEGLDGRQIDRMVERYQENMLTYRAENIALTEAKAVVGAARLEATEQIVEQTGIDRAAVRRTWRATKDNRTRDSHWEMSGQMVGLDEPYVTPEGDEIMYPGDPSAPAKERVRCRCEETIEIDEDFEE